MKLNWNLTEIELALKFVWKIARGSSTSKTNFVVTISDELGNSSKGEIAFNIRYGESQESTKNQFEKLVGDLNLVKDLKDLENILAKEKINSSLRFGIESAYIHLLAKRESKSVCEILNYSTPSGSIKTSFSIPIIEIKEMANFIKQYDLHRFHSIKLKIDRENALDKIAELLKHYHGLIRIDANEAFCDPEEIVRIFEKIDIQRVEFLEQPMAPNLKAEYRFLKENLDLLLIADESLTSNHVDPAFCELFHGINVKLMKSGGYIKAIQQLKSADKLCLKKMLGCMVESSLGISSAYNLSRSVDFFDLDGALLIKNDPFNLVRERQGELSLVK